jgi:hypothetical protein
MQVAASTYKVRVTNSFSARAEFLVSTTSKRAGWTCSVNTGKFEIDPSTDTPSTLEIKFDHPPEAKEGDFADCDVAVYGQPADYRSPVPIGGVTVRTFIPPDGKKDLRDH